MVTINCPFCNGTHELDIQPTEDQLKGIAPVAANFLCPNLDRRYRLNRFHINALRNQVYIQRENPRLVDPRLEAYLKSKLGDNDFEGKLERWLNIDYPTIGITDEYPEIIEEIILAYAQGYNYSAITSTCCLGERILNRLVIKLRDYYKGSPHYKNIYRKDSLDDWGLMIEILIEWQVIKEGTVKDLVSLKKYRNDTIHYNQSYDFNIAAPEAIRLLISVIKEIFGVHNRTDLYHVYNVPGEIWVRSDAENTPFVKEFVLPGCYKAYALHKIDFDKGVIEEMPGKPGKLSDEEFIELRKSSKN